MSRDTLKMLHDAKKNEEPEPTSDRSKLKELLPKDLEEIAVSVWGNSYYYDKENVDKYTELIIWHVRRSPWYCLSEEEYKARFPDPVATTRRRKK